MYKPKSFLLAGGVAANGRLRHKLRSAVKNMKGCTFHVAPADLCTDNAAYIASHAFFNYHPVPWDKITANPQLSITD
jgi:tRNA A37 threonylcarbamoyltransferase TsaD